MKKAPTGHIRVAELFAGVGGFRVGLERASDIYSTVFSSQWEPPGTPSKQFASRCYVLRFGPEGHSNEDISKVLDAVESGRRKLPVLDMVVGGFPCQDYSVAKPLRHATGIVGKKGVLWWQIHRLLRLLKERRRPAQWVVLENVDRLLKSPVNQRGRDFAIMIASLCDLGYEVEWRVVNAADYGFPQRRRRVFIVARRRSSRNRNGFDVVYESGVLARALPVQRASQLKLAEPAHIQLRGALHELSQHFGDERPGSPFGNAGFARGSRTRGAPVRDVWAFRVAPLYNGHVTTLGEVLQEDPAPPKYRVDPNSLPRWHAAKGKKSEPRVHKESGFRYAYSEGKMSFPDAIDKPARTILTSEGGASPSRSKHVIRTPDGSLRRLTPIELERLNGFDDDHTNTSMTDVQRAYCMGNALVVPIVELIARQIADETTP